jgi:hypothetical protein
MNREDDTNASSVETALDRIFASDLGKPAPPSDYFLPMDNGYRAALEEELTDVERADADAAARLPSLYAG